MRYELVGSTPQQLRHLLRTNLDRRIRHYVHVVPLVIEGQSMTQDGMNLLPDSPEMPGTDVGIRGGRRAILAPKHVSLAATAQDMKVSLRITRRSTIRGRPSGSARGSNGQG
jgi:hypothetical protein